MTHRQPSPTKKKVFDADDAYICGGYRHLTRDCTMHFIKTSTMEKLILTAIREVSAYVREDEKQFIRIVQDAASAGQEQTVREQKKRLHKAEKRIAELDELIKKLYKGNATGKIPDKHESEILLHQAAKKFFDETGLKKLPTVKGLQTEYAVLLAEKKSAYAEYRKARDEMKELLTVKANVDRLMGYDKSETDIDAERREER